MIYFQNEDILEIYYSELTNDYQRQYVSKRTECGGKKFIYSPTPVSIEGRKLVYLVSLDYYENLIDIYTAVSEFDDAHCMFYKDNYSDLYFLALHQKNLVLRNEIFLFKPQAWHIIDAQSAAHIISPSGCISSRASVHFLRLDDIHGFAVMICKASP